MKKAGIFFSSFISIGRSQLRAEMTLRERRGVSAPKTVNGPYRRLDDSRDIVVLCQRELRITTCGYNAVNLERLENDDRWVGRVAENSPQERLKVLESSVAPCALGQRSWAPHLTNPSLTHMRKSLTLISMRTRSTSVSMCSFWKVKRAWPKSAATPGTGHWQVDLRGKTCLVTATARSA